ncbi:TIGR04104 family putative zinc finger protein [Planococcus alpniumensis]|uniref:TIGR04104 family putative zinc finger protein n=1 Tax=Planococcus alpniumensis TaxID=2708345 RepID=UPI001B8D062C|nr:TIGR04104 family putative zinc finger protein [Planococcus sp. MSAK28401]
MPKCQNCGTTWTWGQTVCRLFTLGDSLTCPACRQAQYVSMESRKKTSLFVFAAPLIMFISVAFGIDPFVSLALFLASFLVIMGIYPFFIELTDERGPMW